MNEDIAQDGTGHTDESRSVRFQSSGRQLQFLTKVLGRTSLLTLVFGVFAWLFISLDANSIWAMFFGANTAALLLFVAGTRSAAEISAWRFRKAALPPLRDKPRRPFISRLFNASESDSADLPASDPVGDWLHRIVVAGGALIAR